MMVGISPTVNTSGHMESSTMGWGADFAAFLGRACLSNEPNDRSTQTQLPKSSKTFQGLHVRATW